MRRLSVLSSVVALLWGAAPSSGQQLADPDFDGKVVLITDPAPMVSAAEGLGKRFGVDMSKGATSDPANSDPRSPTLLRFNRENKLLGDHPIIRGRDESERVNSVLTFTGQSLKG